MEANMTAVQWLFEQTIRHNGIVPVEVIEQAVELEKQQIVDAHIAGYYSDYKTSKDLQGEKYYNETYGA
jgi:hypothetical protein